MKSPRLKTLGNVTLYGVTPSGLPEEELLKRVEKACEGGVDVIQLRDKTLSAEALLKRAKELKKICAKFGVLFLMNDRADVAVGAGADGVHLGQEDLPISVARQILGYHKIIGKSTHSLVEAFQAEKEGADYVSCGPVWATPTKPEYPAVGLSLLTTYADKLKIPFVAIGGIDLSNVAEVIRAGVKRVAVVRALFEAFEPAQAASEFQEAIRKAFSL